jgi:UDP-N-acetyl-D-mannosaminuronate dehydrogenase
MQIYGVAAPAIPTSFKSLGIPIHPITNIEIAEITKIAENAHRFLQISFAEELYGIVKKVT